MSQLWSRERSGFESLLPHPVNGRENPTSDNGCKGEKRQAGKGHLAKLL